jgi:hypothetical protein
VHKTPVTVQVLAHSLQNSRSLTSQPHDIWLWPSALFDLSLKILAKFESYDKKRVNYKPDVQESVHRDKTIKITDKMQYKD